VVDSEAVKSVIEAWRGECIELSSSLQVDVVRERLAAGTVAPWRAGFVNGGGHLIVGRVGRRRVTVTATHRPEELLGTDAARTTGGHRDRVPCRRS
jgi:hypothetical protein